MLAELATTLAASPAHADGLARLVADRTAPEQVYYAHRLGTQPPFDQTLPPDRAEAYVRQDLKKEAILKRLYGTKVTPVMIEAEAARINSSSHAPEILKELKTALDNNPERFGQTVVKPLLVDRLLRDHFENDEPVHAPQRSQMEAVRERLCTGQQRGLSIERLVEILKQAKPDQVTEAVWQLGARPSALPSIPPTAPGVVGTREEAKPALAPSPSEGDTAFYFEDLPVPLRKVLRVQLSKAGDFSAVIELRSRFNLYLATEKNRDALRVAVLSIPKLALEEWLAKQSDYTP